MNTMMKLGNQFISAERVKTEKIPQREKSDSAGNVLEDLMGRITTLYQDKIENFTDARFYEYGREIQKSVIKNKISKALLISESQNMNKIISDVAIVIKKYLPKLDIEAIEEDVEKEMRKMEVKK